MTRRQRRKTQQRHSSRGVALAIGALTVIVVALLAAAVAQRWGGTSQPEMPQGTARVGDVEASQPSVDLGHVPLDVNVEQKFVLRNVGTSPATLGEAKIDVLEGC